MVTTERVVISNGTACLRPIFVIIEDVVGQIGKLAEILLDIEDIWIEVKVFIAVRICL